MVKNAGQILKGEEASGIVAAAFKTKGKNRGAHLLRLTPRELAVFKGLRKGLLYKEIACELEISFSAVHKYQNAMFKKLCLTNRSQVMLLKLEIGSIPLDASRM